MSLHQTTTAHLDYSLCAAAALTPTNNLNVARDTWRHNVLFHLQCTKSAQQHVDYYYIIGDNMVTIMWGILYGG